MEKIRGKQVVYANRCVYDIHSCAFFLSPVYRTLILVLFVCRYSPEHRFRPAASPIITEVLPDGRKKIRGGRHGDDMPIPKPTGTAAVKKQRKRKNKKKN